MVEPKITCENCGSTSIYIDMKLGEIVCKKCAVIFNSYVVWKNEIYDK